jgi:hypothetical protein
MTLRFVEVFEAAASMALLSGGTIPGINAWICMNWSFEVSIIEKSVFSITC